MSNQRISNATTSDLTNLSGFETSVNSAEQDTPGTSFMPNWSKWFGYYKVIPELQAVIDKKAIWTIGKGFIADVKVKKILGKIKGNGKDTFNGIMYNMITAYTICGDSFAEIIKNHRGELVNLKPINPGSMSIVSNDSGIITGYEQNVISTGTKIKFKPEDIFHLSWNRLGDEPHGRSTIEKIERIILMRNEAMEDMKLVFHRYVSPLNIWKLDTDDSSEITAFKAKVETTYKNKENLFIPKDTVELERAAIPQYSTLDPLPWINTLNHYFLISEGVPEVILGYGKDATEASSKIMYLAFQQVIERNQLFLEEQIKLQLGLDVEFNFPENIAENLKTDERKDGSIKGEKKSEIKQKEVAKI